MASQHIDVRATRRQAAPSRLVAGVFAMLWLVFMSVAGAQANKIRVANKMNGDAIARGEQLYTARCGACHSIADNGAGPRHRGLFGRKAGTQTGFDYSPALRGSGLTWNRKLLDRWIANPTALVPGNKMVVQLANDPQDRAAILAYLEMATR